MYNRSDSVQCYNIATAIASSVRLHRCYCSSWSACLLYAYVSASYTVALLCLLQYCQHGYDHQ